MSSFAEMWARRIADAQADQTLEIQGEIFWRVPLGADYGTHCPDCLVEVGQLHVPGCDLEVCPRCAQQVMTCRCH